MARGTCACSLIAEPSARDPRRAVDGEGLEMYGGPCSAHDLTVCHRLTVQAVTAARGADCAESAHLLLGPAGPWPCLNKVAARHGRQRSRADDSGEMRPLTRYISGELCTRQSCAERAEPDIEMHSTKPITVLSSGADPQDVTICCALYEARFGSSLCTYALE